MEVTQERRIAYAVFAVGAALTILTLAGCGGDVTLPAPGPTPRDEPPSSSSRAAPPAEMSDVCLDEGTSEQEYAAQGFGTELGSIRMTYASGGSISPCGARLEDSRLVLLVLDPEVSTGDLRVHCAEVSLEEADFEGLEDGTSEGGQFAANQDVLEDVLGKRRCTSIPLVE